MQHFWNDRYIPENIDKKIIFIVNTCMWIEPQIMFKLQNNNNKI